MENVRPTVDLWLEPEVEPYCAERQIQALKLISTAEKMRMTRFARPEDQHRFLQTRLFMRSVLAGYFDRVDPASLQFDVALHGKPVLLEDAVRGVGCLHFNLSHTRGMAVLAVSRHYPVGVDVEAVNRKVELLALAQRYFSRQEAEQVALLEGEQQREYFFGLWTLKEAWVKAKGLGLRVPLDAFSFTLGSAASTCCPDPGIGFSTLPELNEEPADWGFFRLAEKQFRIALAYCNNYSGELNLAIHHRQTQDSFSQF